MRLGLDELMIVNPAPGGLGAAASNGEDRRMAGQYFLGADDTLYQVKGLATTELSGADGTISGFFLGDDGTLYQLMPQRPR